MNDLANQLRIEEARPSGATELAQLAAEIWPTAYEGIISREQIQYMLDWMYDPARIRSEIANGTVWLLAKLRAQTLGFASFGPLQPGKICALHKIYVSPKFHRNGIGSKLIDEIENQIRSLGADRVELRVNRQNENAIAFYERHRYKRVKEDLAEIGGGFVMDDYLYQKVVSFS